jgi:phosphatidylserine/phosphatidylglycerophosphate/cardiolipin synthase-like enzyme
MAISVQPSPLTGRDISLALYGRLRRSTAKCYVVSPFLQDYEFRPVETLSRFLGRYVDGGVDVTLLTRPPMGSRQEIRRKWKLLEAMERVRIPVQVNPALHAKVYLFIDAARPMTLVGSANMTSGGMDKYVELALLSHNSDLASRVEAKVVRFLQMPTTQAWRRWSTLNAATRPKSGPIN